MKKIVYLLMVMGAIFTGCNPIEDINNEIDAEGNQVKGEDAFTMTTADYADLVMQGEDDPVDYYELNEGFSDIDDAKTMLPAFLAIKYQYWGEGSSVEVTFNLSTDIINEEAYTVSSQDYADLGFNFGNFSDESDFQAFFAFKYPDAARGDLVELTYQWWSGSVETRTDKFILLSEWKKTTQFSDEDYTAMGQGFSNFSDEEEAEFKIGIYLGLLNPFAQTDDEIVTLYKFYNGTGVEDKVVPYVYDGDKWNLMENTVKFGLKDGVWIPDNTIRYTLVGADYDYMSAQLIAEPDFEGPAENMGNFGSFNIDIDSDNYWSPEMLLTAFDILLDNLNASAADGQKYIITYKAYDGNNVITVEKKLIKTGGNWIFNTEE